jgi:hypothetical protein
MKKFEAMFIIIFLQIGFIIVGLTEIQTGQQLLTPYINASFLNTITGLAESSRNFLNSITEISFENIFTAQEFRICIPTIFSGGLNVCSPSINLPGVGFINILGSTLAILWNLGILFLTTLINAIIIPGLFYTAIILTILPTNGIATAYVGGIGMLIGLLQSVIIMSDVIRSIKSLKLFSSGVDFNLEE